MRKVTMYIMTSVEAQRIHLHSLMCLPYGKWNFFQVTQIKKQIGAGE